MANGELPWWVKAITYVAVPVGIIVAAGYIINNLLLGPLKQVADLWNSQWQDFVQELKEYSAEDNGNLTTAHLQILYGNGTSSNLGKVGVMQQTAKTYESISGQLYGTVAVIGGFVVAGFTVLGIVKALLKWRGQAQANPPQTMAAAAYYEACALADELSANGLASQAAALSSAIRSQFSSVDQPFLQGQISQFQSLLPSLTGFEAAYASFMIQALTTDLVTIPGILLLIP